MYIYILFFVLHIYIYIYLYIYMHITIFIAWGHSPASLLSIDYLCMFRRTLRKALRMAAVKCFTTGFAKGGRPPELAHSAGSSPLSK